MVSESSVRVFFFKALTLISVCKGCGSCCDDELRNTDNSFQSIVLT